MAHYIDKAALVAEIIRRRKVIPKEEEDKRLKAVYGNEAFVLTELLEYIDTLEVKEVDLEKELDSMITPELKLHKALPSLFDVAKHFFELGMVAGNKIQKGEEV